MIEGRILQRLLEKMEQMRAVQADRIFDVVGEVLSLNDVNLPEFLREAAHDPRRLEESLDQIEKVVASECVNWKLSDLQAEHRRVFSNVITLDCPPYETLFGNDHVFAQCQVMGYIAGFYRAFGVELSKNIHERLDHAMK